MRDGPTFRSIGIALALVLAISLAGCGALGGGGGGGCGPGDTKISNLEPGTAQETTITGRVTTAGPGSVVLDDGSGKAFVMVGQNGLSKGDCVTATGVASQIPGGTQADVGFTATNVSQA
jgi:hypothetical protein